MRETDMKRDGEEDRKRQTGTGTDMKRDRKRQTQGHCVNVVSVSSIDIS